MKYHLPLIRIPNRTGVTGIPFSRPRRYICLCLPTIGIRAVSRNSRHEGYVVVQPLNTEGHYIMAKRHVRENEWICAIIRFD